METFRKLFSPMLVFVYHCFDRIVINSYVLGLSRPDQLSYFFREVVGVSAITKEVLRARTDDYKRWVEAYARNQSIPIEWAQSGVRKEDHVKPHLTSFLRKRRYGVYFMLRSMERGPNFRSSLPKFDTSDPGYRILAKQRSRFTHYYFYICDEVLGPISLRVGSFLPFQITYYINGHNFIEAELARQGVKFRKSDNAFLSVSDPSALQQAADRLTHDVIRKRLEYWTLVVGPKFSKSERKAMNLSRSYAIAQIEYCANFIFRRNFPIKKMFDRACEMGLWRLTSDKISVIFGTLVTKKLKGRLNTTLERFEHGQHVFRAYWKNSFVKQYEKFSTFLRHEVCSNDLTKLGLRKSLDKLPAIQKKLSMILDRYTNYQANWFNVHFDFPLFERLAKPVNLAATRLPGIKIHDTRMLRLMEVLLHAGPTLSGWPTSQIHYAVISTFRLTDETYKLNQLRYDLRKMKAHGLIERDGRRYSYRLTEKGLKVSLMFVLFHKRLCGPLANSLFHHRPDPSLKPDSKLERAYYKADASIQQLVELLAA